MSGIHPAKVSHNDKTERMRHLLSRKGKKKRRARDPVRPSFCDALCKRFFVWFKQNSNTWTVGFKRTLSIEYSRRYIFLNWSNIDRPAVRQKKIRLLPNEPGGDAGAGRGRRRQRDSGLWWFIYRPIIGIRQLYRFALSWNKVGLLQKCQYTDWQLMWFIYGRKKEWAPAHYGLDIS